MSDITVRLQITLIFVGDENWKLRPNFRILKYLKNIFEEKVFSANSEISEEKMRSKYFKLRILSQKSVLHDFCLSTVVFDNDFISAFF